MKKRQYTAGQWMLILVGMRSAVGISAFLVIGVIWIFMSASFCVERNRMKKIKNLKNT